MARLTRECRIIADGGLLTPCKNCGQYHGPNGGYRPKPNLDFSQEPPERIQFLLDIINKNMPIVEKGIAEAKTDSERRRWERIRRKYLQMTNALEEAKS